MKRNCRWSCGALGLLLAVASQGAFAGADPDSGRDEMQLARINLPELQASFPLPVHAWLQDAAGQGYVLVKAPAAELAASELAGEVLDENVEGVAYILAFEFRAGARAAAVGRFKIVHDDGRRLIIRAGAGGELEELAELGFQCRGLAAEPLDLALLGESARISRLKMAAITSNATVSAMMAQVLQTNLYVSLAELTGVQAVMADGTYATIRTRHQNSGTPIRRATALAFEKFTALGLQTSYHNWVSGSRSNRNVIGTWAGTSSPSEIVVLCAHIDDMPSGSDAPGADDNASGSVAVMAAAEILKAHAYQRTIRFILFTGEEQGMLGSDAYARAARNAGDNIVAVLNFDMLAWDSNSDGVLHLYVRPSSDPGSTADRDIAGTFTNVVRTYGLQSGLAPAVIAEVSDWSDHYSFTSQGFPAICGIEEDVDDFNPYYHTVNDTLARLNMAYYTRYVKAGVGTIAHLARLADGSPVLAIAPSSTNVPATASSGRQIAVTAANVSWTAATNVPWLAITGGSSGATNGTVTFSVASNGTVAARTGLITVAGSGLVRTCTVVQAAGAASPSLSINPASTNVPAMASSGRQIAVTAANVSWTATTNVPWLAITAGASGSTNGTVTFSVASNGTVAARTGLITVAGSGLVRTCTVVQTAASGAFAPRRINCGGPAIAGAAPWLADTGFLGGGVWTTTATIANATSAPMAVYQRERSGSPLRYSIANIPNGSYRVRLHFNDMSAASSAGKRVFHVDIEGVRVQTNLDVFVAAGGTRRALVRAFDVNVTGGNGLQLELTRVASYPQLNGIEIEAAGPPAPAIATSVSQVTVPEEATATFGVHLDTAPAGAVTVAVVRASGDSDLTVSGGASLVFTTANYGTDQTVTLAAAHDADSTAGTAVIQCTAPGYTAAGVTATEQDHDVPAFSLKVNCGGPALTGGWVADTGFLNGRVWTTAAAVANATLAPMALYQRERSSAPLRYSLTAVPNGSYEVKLHFNDMSSPGRVGQRLFNVYLEGALAEANLDVFALAGGRMRALVRTYNVTVAGGNGLQIELTRVAGYPQMNGIEITAAAAPPGRRTGSVRISVPRPDLVLTSEEPQGPGTGWLAVDGDLETAWRASGRQGSWICLGYEKAVTLRAVDVQFTPESPAAIFTLASADAREWFELEPELELGPVAANYLWFIFPAAPRAPPPAVREIQVLPAR